MIQTDGPGSRPDPTIISSGDEEDSESDRYSSVRFKIDSLDDEKYAIRIASEGDGNPRAETPAS
ncbi:hypothetical protein FPSE_09043 [Fusarium pseudograminearum CS3096]|uniref:Uncharacterized protein n=1 Tax=Fusarium pseudograminearum (strain CS3096) TaxID=1028729 RepID=K3VYJ3_FUSPC|nr:hypothetical protein FPSE_09043 [Fusarium pseudograminearum CS3096]EKJ70750.1 hypothetical protein FPSE_09043 [Fusarium pseudograminearum CS3096]